ncbi:MAG: carboxymuconolactone decarboxylase family protein [Hyphomonadaceae bacterium]|nr:carboxymuconolactone decarboxylase family protein [Hyphomonadaceae bacterium]
MNLETLKTALPDYAKDLKLNLGTLSNETSLTDQQKWGTFLACAFAVGEPKTIQALVGETEGKLTPEAAKAAKAAASIMAMNNVYYRFTHLVNNEVFLTTPAKLRMTVIGAPGIEKADFELYCMAVSAVNGCGKCMDAHEEELRKAGFTTEQIQASVRIGAVVNAVARTLAAEAALA